MNKSNNAMHLQEDTRSSQQILEEILEIYNTLQHRWKEYQRYAMYTSTQGENDIEPMFTDENGRRVSCKKALAPCDIINQSLDRFVTLSMGIYAKPNQDTLFQIIQNNPTVTKAIDELRQIAIHAEEAMEKEALELIFAAIEKHPNTYQERIQKFSKRILQNEPTLDEKTAILKALVVDFPQWNQNKNPKQFPGLVFKYFDNYVNLVASELLLLQPSEQKKMPSLARSSSSQDILQTVKIESSLKRSNSCKSLSHVELHDEKKAYDFTHPANRHLSEKVFTFVGAGFPFTGIILHQNTGAKVKLVDCDEEAVQNANRFIQYCENVGCIQPGALEVIHANVLDMQFRPMDKDHCHVKKADAAVIHTDILDLASAIPSQVTNHVLQHNIHPEVLVRKRNVQGMSKLLYERYDLDASVPYELVAEVTTPQDALQRKDLPKIVGLTKINNINSCELFVRKLDNSPATKIPEFVL